MPNFAKTLLDWSIFERPSPWWLVLHETDVPYTEVYNTSPRRNFTAYSLGGPCAPSFCTCVPNVKNYSFAHRLTIFCEPIVMHSRYRSIAPVGMYSTPSAVGGPILGITALPASTPTTQSVISTWIVLLPTKLLIDNAVAEGSLTATSSAHQLCPWTKPENFFSIILVRTDEIL